ncbi:MAG: type II secretion system protein GspC [Thermodesulfovibrionales bacterium]
MKTAGIADFFRQPKAMTAVNLLLAVLLLVAVLFFIRDIISIAVPLKEKSSTAQSRPKDPPRRNLQDYSAILTKNPFGFPAGELKPLSVASGPSVAQSDIILTGTVSGRRDLSYAVFADKTGRQEVFRIGQQVFGLGKLSKIETTRVFIREGGRETEVGLKDLADIREIKPPAAPSSASFGRRVGDATYQVDQQRVQQAIEKPAQIMTDARFVPNIIEGKQQGFVLREVKPAGIYSSLGLQNGDVLVRINELTISNPESALQAFTALRGVDRVHLDIIRNGAKMTMTYQIR